MLSVERILCYRAYQCNNIVINERLGLTNAKTKEEEHTNILP